ncbi:MAG: sensory rhodopsin transducer, partial [Christensenellales bacterium]
EIGGFHAECGARRTHHIRLDRIRSDSGEPIQRDVPYSVLLESDEPVVVQYSRLDTSSTSMALMTTIAYAVE